MSERTLSRFLLLPELNLTKIETVGRAGAHYHVDKVSEFEVCPKCACKSTSVYDRRKIRVKDEPIRGKYLLLIITKRRFWCKCCLKPFTEPVPGISKGGRVTQRFKRSLCWAAETFSDLTKVQKAYRCSTRIVYKTFYEVLERKSKARAHSFPKSIGIDEHSLRKPKFRATEYTTIIVDHNHKAVFELVDGRSRSDLVAALSHIRGAENVKNVTIDMSPTYRSFCRNFFPNAKVIADRFHVQRLFSKLLNKERLKIFGDKRRLKVRSILLRKGKSLDSSVRRALHKYLKDYPTLLEIYLLKERFIGFYNIKGQFRAQKAFKSIVDDMAKSANSKILELRRLLINWRKEILAYFENRMSNGRVEGFNRKAKLVQRKAFGYSSFKNYRLRVLNECRGKALRGSPTMK